MGSTEAADGVITVLESADGMKSATLEVGDVGGSGPGG